MIEGTYFLRQNRGPIVTVASWAMVVAAVALSSSGCAKKSEKAAPTNGAAGAPPPVTAASPPSADEVPCNCHATLSGPISGNFDCEGRSKFYIPPSKNQVYSGNTDLSLVATVAFPKFKLPAGVDMVTWAGLFRGPLKAGGTYTEKDLIPRSPVGVAVVSMGSIGKQFSNVKRLKFIVKSVTPGDVRDDPTFSGGKVRSDKISGDLELVLSGPGEVTIRARYD